MKKMLSVLMAIMVITSMINVSASSEGSTDIDVVFSCADGNLSSAAVNVFAWQGKQSSSVEKNSLGGKTADDAYTKFTTSSSKDGFMQIELNSDAYDMNYTVFSLELYGNAIPLKCVSRFSSSLQVEVILIGTELLTTGWNNISLVFEKETRDLDLYINGKYIKSNNLDSVIKGYNYPEYNGTIPMFRFIMFKRGATSYCDNISLYKTNEYPSFNMPCIIEDGGFENTSQIVIAGSEGVSITAEEGTNLMVSGDSGISWTEKSNAAIGDLILVAKDLKSGDVVYSRLNKIYKCVDKSYSAVIIDQDTMNYSQGGTPKNADGTTITDTRMTINDLYGSQLDMTYAAVGVNNQSKSKQSYYYFDWDKANDYPSKYLVAEYDFAFPAETDTVKPASSIGITTNGGATISTGIGTNYCYKNRINHYIWIYDTQTGLYSVYVNGKPLNENVKILENFKNGSNTAMRFTISMGNDSSGDITRQYAAYIDNITVYECNTEPEIKIPVFVPDAKYSTLPITQKKITVNDIKSLFDEEDREYVTVYTSDDYSEKAENDTEVSAGSAMIVTQKNGIYDYAKLCLAPYENADYALEDIQEDSEDITVSVINYADKRIMLPILIGYNDDVIADISFNETTCSKGNTISAQISTKNIDHINLMVWDNFASIKPLGSIIEVK